MSYVVACQFLLFTDGMCNQRLTSIVFSQAKGELVCCCMCMWGCWGFDVHACSLEGFWAFFVWNFFSEEKCRHSPLKFLNMLMIWWAFTWMLELWLHLPNWKHWSLIDLLHCTLLFHFFSLIPLRLETTVPFELVYTLFVAVLFGFHVHIQIWKLY